MRIFDVVELTDGNRATILKIINNNFYKVEIVNKNGVSKGIKEIQKSEIKKVIITK